MSLKIRSYKQDNLSLKKLNTCMVVAAILISLVLFFAMSRTSSMYDEAHVVTEEIKNYETTAYNLQTASDYLTEQIRLFVITGDKKNLDNYFEESNVTKRRDDAVEMLRARHGDSPAFTELQSAMNGSLVLMVMEYHAARLAVDAFGHDLEDYPKEVQSVRLSDYEASLSPQQKGDLAKRMVFSEEYRRQKTFISEHTMNCLMQLEKEIWEQQAAVSYNLKKTMFIEHLLTALLIAILLGIVYLTSRLVIFPLRDYVNLIRENERLPVTGADELRFLAETYNAMRETNRLHQEQLTYEATHDKLTTLYNRRGFEMLLDNLNLSNFAVILVDLDKFKSINDIYGHDTGDKVLIKVSKVLLDYFGDNGHICRLGGDEFVILMENATSSIQDQLKKTIESINQWLRAAHDGLPPITISVGVTFCTKNTDVLTLLKRADEALYDAKGHGRSAIQFDTPAAKK